MNLLTPLFFVELFQGICRSNRVLKIDFRSENLPHHPHKTSNIFCSAFLFIFLFIRVDLCSEIDQKRIYILLVLYYKFLVSTNNNFLQIFCHFCSFSSKFYLLVFCRFVTETWRNNLFGAI
jgi:hypothetical protein